MIIDDQKVFSEAKYPKKKYDAIVLKTENVALGVKKITFKILEPFSFLPWQYVWVEISNMKIFDPRGSRRAFSIFNTINSDNNIEIVARISDSGYKQNLFALTVNDKVVIHGPFGNSFIVDKEHQPENIVMIAGGVGISVFLPLLKTVRDNALKSKCYLVYLNKDKETTPFLSELMDLKKSVNFFDFKDKYEYFSWDDVKDVASQMNGRIEWWVTGNQAMVNHVYNELLNAGVSRLDMVFENFYPTNSAGITIETVKKHMTSDDLFLRAIENSTNHTVITDLEGVVLFANKAAEKITGFSQEEMLGNTPRLWGGMMSRQFYIDFWSRKKSGESFSGEIVNRRKNGDLYSAIAHITPIKNKNNEMVGYIGTEDDITDRTIMEEKVVASNRFLDAIVSNLPNMVFVKNAEDLRFTLFNKAGENITGFSAQQLLGKNDYDFFPKEQADMFVSKDREVLNKKVGINIEEEEITTKNNEKRFLHTAKVPILDSSGNAKFLLGISEDITEKRQRAKELAAEKAKIEVIIEGMADGVAVADSQGRLIYLNKVGATILGRGASQSSPEVWSKEYGLFDPVTQKEFPVERLPLTLALKGELVKNCIIFVRNPAIPNGMYISVSATPISVNGILEGAVAIFRDVTKDVEIDRAKTEFISLASHQLRTPLSTINWYVEMLMAGDAGPINEEQKKFLQEAYEGSKRMVALVNALLNVSRIESNTYMVNPEPIDVVRLLQSVLDEMKPKIENKKLQVHFQGQGIPIISLDPNLTTIIFQNLLTNAIKYTNDAGSVTITLRIVKKDEEIADIKASEDCLLVEVQDTGMGIPMADQPKIFTKLFRAHNAQEIDVEGTGLGLYLIKGLIERSKGKVWFFSEEKKGTTFFAMLPLAGMEKKEGTKKIDV